MRNNNYEENFFGYGQIKNQIKGCNKYAPSAEAVAIRNKEYSELWNAVESMSRKDRKIVYHILIDGMSVISFVRKYKLDYQTTLKRKNQIAAALREVVINA